MEQLATEIDLGPDFGIATLQEVPIEIIEQNNDIHEIFKDLAGLRDIMLEFNIITSQQGEQLGTAAEEVAVIKDTTESGVQELTKAYEYKEYLSKRRQGVTRVVAIVGGSGMGIAGFLVNPLLGIGAMVAGGGIGWFLTRRKTVDTILRVVPTSDSDS
jgi:hypothetical protein